MRGKDWNQIVSENNDNWKTLIEEASSTVTYIGKARHDAATSDAVWQIQKIDESTSPIKISFADSDDDFKFVWDSRASYTY